MYACMYVRMYEGVSRSFRTESITKFTLTTITTRWEATQRVMAAKLTRLTHRIAIQLPMMADSCTICSSRSRRSGRKLLDTPSYFWTPGILNKALLRGTYHLSQTVWMMAHRQVLKKTLQIAQFLIRDNSSDSKRRKVGLWFVVLVVLVVLVETKKQQQNVAWT
jgi:hypothetical protein